MQQNLQDLLIENRLKGIWSSLDKIDLNYNRFTSKKIKLKKFDLSFISTTTHSIPESQMLF